MNIIRAKHLGMCFGVRDAIAFALETARRGPLTILGDLVHNERVLAELRSEGIRIAQQPDEIGTPTVMVTAHGASQRAIQQTRRRGLNVLEATCPLVRLAHRAVAVVVGEGWHPIIIGRRDHVEVRGMTEDLETYDVVLSDQDVERLGERQRYGVVAQTTQPIERVRHLVALIRRRFPAAEVRLIDTVCQATKLRQQAAIDLARTCDTVIVIGGAQSSNTRELVGACSRRCPRVYHIQTADDLRAVWVGEAETIGITAGTSTPEDVITGVERRLRLLSDRTEHHEPTCNQSSPLGDGRDLRRRDGVGRGGGRVLSAHAGGTH
jgi:4-hydroxy-3-methylbut-2-enyl diphosphate reductase